MAEVVMTCGKICSGKSTYARKLSKERNAVILSVDEITLELFPEGVGEMHDAYVERAERYLYRKSLEIVRTGTNVILDWGFWTRAEREYAREFYSSHNIASEIHYLEIGTELWHKRINDRNELVRAGKVSAYYVDEGLAEKFSAVFEEPEADEINYIIRQEC